MMTDFLKKLFSCTLALLFALPLLLPLRSAAQQELSPTEQGLSPAEGGEAPSAPFVEFPAGNDGVVTRVYYTETLVDGLPQREFVLDDAFFASELNPFALHDMVCTQKPNAKVFYPWLDLWGLIPFLQDSSSTESFYTADDIYLEFVYSLAGTGLAFERSFDYSVPKEGDPDYLFNTCEDIYGNSYTPAVGMPHISSYSESGNIYKTGYVESAFADALRKDGLLLENLTTTQIINTTLTATFYDSESDRSMRVKFILPQYTLHPYKNGDLVYCNNEYVYVENYREYCRLEFVCPDEIVFDRFFGFSHDEYEAKWYYVINGTTTTAAPDGWPNITFEDENFPSAPYEITGKIEVRNRRSGEVLTCFYTNTVQVKRHALELRTDYQYESNLMANKEYTFSVALNRGADAVTITDLNWRFFEERNTQKDSPDDPNNVNTAPYNPAGQDVKYTYTTVGTHQIEVTYKAQLDARSKVEFYSKTFEVSIAPDESARITPDYVIRFNQPENGMLMLGGEPLLLRGEIEAFYGDENFGYTYTVTTSDGAVVYSEQTADGLLITPLSEGRVTVLCIAESETAGSYRKLITFGITSLLSEGATVTFKNDQPAPGQDVKAFLSVGDTFQFLNFKPIWRIEKENGERPIVMPFTVNEDGAAVLATAERGFYNFFATDANGNSVSRRILVADRTQVPHYEITFNISDEQYLLVGGNAIDIFATIEEVFGDEAFTLSYQVATSQGATVYQNPEAKTLSLTPLTPGTVTVTCTAKSEIAGIVHKTLTLHILAATAENTVIRFKDDFNKTGSDVVAYFSVAGVERFANFTPTWTVKEEVGEEHPTVVTEQTEDGGVLLRAAERGFYLFSTTAPGVPELTERKRVANINIEEFAKKAVPVIAVLLIAVITGVVVLKKKWLARSTAQAKLAALADFLEQKLTESTDQPTRYRRDIHKVEYRLRMILGIAESLDEESLGQYQTVCANLKNAISVTIATQKCNGELSPAQRQAILNSLLTTFIRPTALLCEELSHAMSFHAAQKDTDAIVRVPQGEEKAREAQPSYLEMLKKFFYQGDEEKKQYEDDDDGADEK